MKQRKHVKNKYLPVIFFLALAIVLQFLLVVIMHAFEKTTPTVSSVSQTKNSLTVRGVHVSYERADTPLTRAHGLSDRLYLEEGAGMLFVFDSIDLYGFWMKDMHFPLDFVFIRDKKVVDLIEKVPVPLGEPIPFTAKEPFDAVLEVNTGWIAANHIQVGDSVAF